MSVFESSPSTPPVLRAELPLLDEAELAAAAFLARYSGRTLQSYRTDLRQFFEWAHDVGLAPLGGTRAHIEICTIDRATRVGVPRPVPLSGRVTERRGEAHASVRYRSRPCPSHTPTAASRR